MAHKYIDPCFTPKKTPSDKSPKSDENVVFKHDKDGLAIYITIYNASNTNEGSETGLKQEAGVGGPISLKKGQNADQSGQMIGKHRQKGRSRR